jgi:hypothetical protein
MEAGPVAVSGDQKKRRTQTGVRQIHTVEATVANSRLGRNVIWIDGSVEIKSKLLIDNHCRGWTFCSQRVR